MYGDDKVIFADEPYQSYEDMYKAKLRVRSIGLPGRVAIPDQLQEVYDESDMKEFDLSEEELRHLVFE